LKINGNRDPQDEKHVKNHGIDEELSEVEFFRIGNGSGHFQHILD
jgi:hypothetical protein